MKVGLLFPANETPYETIAELAKNGFDNGQLSFWNMDLYTDHFVSEIKRACADFNFTITAVWCGWTGPIDWSYPNMYVTLGLVPSEWRAQRVKDLLHGAALARELGVKDIVTHIGYLPDNPFHPDHMGLLQALKYICKELKKYDQRFLFETGEELPLSLMHLIVDTGMDNLGINLDPANLILNGRAGHPATALRFFGSYVKGFHAKDALQPEAPLFTKKMVCVGEGDANFPELVKALKEVGFDGSLTIEHEFSSDDRWGDILKTKEYLEQLIAEVG